MLKSIILIKALTLKQKLYTIKISFAFYRQQQKQISVRISNIQSYKHSSAITDFYHRDV